MRGEKKKYNIIFSDIDLLIIKEILKKPVCIRDLTNLRNSTNNNLIELRMKNLINLGLLKKENPIGKRINYSVKNKIELLKLKRILEKSYNFYNPKD